jgi:hypothetical protein
MGAAPAAHHHHDELLAIAPGRHRQVVPGLLGEARLQRLHAQGIVEEGDLAGVDAAAVDERLPAQEQPGGRVLLEQSQREHSHVPGGAALREVG